MTDDRDRPDVSLGDSWELVADEWERNRDRLFDAFRPTSEWLVQMTQPTPGETILDVAAGPGESGFLALEAAGPTARLISTDLAPTMVAAAKRGAAARGLDNVECRVMDAQAMDLGDDSVDVVISRLGLMLMPDPRAALAEVRRVLRPGGRLAYAVMGPPDRNQWMSLMMGALMQAGRAPVGANPFALGGVFGLASPAVNEELLAAAGFSEIRCGSLAGSMPVESADDLWDLQTKVAGPVRVTVASMSDAELATARRALAEMTEPFAADGGGYDLPTEVTTAAAVA